MLNFSLLGYAEVGFLGSMLPQYMSLSVSLSVSLVCQKQICVRSLGYIVGAPPPLCVSIHWILACCLLRFAAFFFDI